MTPHISIFNEIEGTRSVFPRTDVSLLQERRVLYYFIVDGRLFVFNVDTRTNVELDVGGQIWNVASLTGIDSGVKAVFQNSDNCIYTLNMDDTTTQVGGRQDHTLMALLPSSSDPKSVRGDVIIYEKYLAKVGKKVDTNHLIRFYGRSLVRVYRDIFLAYDGKTESWLLIRITVP